MLKKETESSGLHRIRWKIVEPLSGQMPEAFETGDPEIFPPSRLLL